MGMFGLTDKIFGRRKHDVSSGDIRSHVLGESGFGREPPREPTIREKYGFPDPASPEFQDVPEPPALDEPLAMPRRRLGARPEPEDMDFGPPRRDMGMGAVGGRDYDIIDRLNLIESQLSAIRSQTETINERLKNLDAKLGGRRY